MRTKDLKGLGDEISSQQVLDYVKRSNFVIPPCILKTTKGTIVTLERFQDSQVVQDVMNPDRLPYFQAQTRSEGCCKFCGVVGAEVNKTVCGTFCAPEREPYSTHPPSGSDDTNAFKYSCINRDCN